MRQSWKRICWLLLSAFTYLSRIRSFVPCWSRLERFWSAVEKSTRYSVADHDVWYRCITNRKHLKSDGTLHHASLRSFIDAPAITRAKWKAELSGRLRSVGDNICEDGQRRAKLQREKRPEMADYFQFVAVVFAERAAIRKWAVDRTDVLFHPICRDRAHANLIFFNKPPNELKSLTLLKAIIKELGNVSANDVHLIPPAQGGPPR